VAASGVATSIEGVALRRLDPSQDERGALVEICRHCWVEPRVPVQWNLVVSRPGVLRGVHWHALHTDYICAVSGAAWAVLVDLRPGSPTELATALVEVDAKRPALLEIPVGVGHGFYSESASSLLYAVTRYWDPDDEFGVRHDDPELALPWPDGAAGAVISERDRAMPFWSDAPRPAVWRPPAERAALSRR
jgi:dTDP-4-dehydrorhamnose 3,5-epimerase